jgi:2-polyprenyl-6-methoxyphenol hydroxylase-like FAD-dependent oxidoreductase
VGNSDNSGNTKDDTPATIGPSGTVVVAGAGIAGLTLALTCHQLGIDVEVYESTRELRPLGVGINVQPNAVRELIDLGLGHRLPEVGVATREYGFYTKFGDEIWTEPRGRYAGYAWPQYSVHRGQLQMLLYHTACERLGADKIKTGCRATGFTNHEDHAVLHIEHHGGRAGQAVGSVVIGADGLHSAVRAQMVPNEGPPKWGGSIMWRGATRAKPFRGGASMALLGHYDQKFVAYPISDVEPDGTVLMNWIAELRFASNTGEREDWNRRASADEFADQFAHWSFDWIDIPGLITSTDEIFEYPMVDRDPLDRWTVGRTTLTGDAAHIMYPVGSNGASQAIVDCRKLGRAFCHHGIEPEALAAYEAELRPATAAMVLRNRSKGPDYVMEMVEQRSGGIFDDINDVMPHAEREAFAANYKGVAGFSIEQLNASPPIIPPDLRVGQV